VSVITWLVQSPAYVTHIECLGSGTWDEEVTQVQISWYLFPSQKSLYWNWCVGKGIDLMPNLLVWPKVWLTFWFGGSNSQRMYRWISKVLTFDFNFAFSFQYLRLWHFVCGSYWKIQVISPITIFFISLSSCNSLAKMSELFSCHWDFLYRFVTDFLHTKEARWLP
jgi:hypothetical protein